MLCSAQLVRHQLDLPLPCSWTVFHRMLALELLATGPGLHTGEQPWRDRLRAVVRNFMCEPCVIALRIVKQNFCIYLFPHEKQAGCGSISQVPALREG